MVTDGSCPRGTVSEVDSDASTPAADASASIAKGARMKGSFVATFHLQDITSAAANIPFRCAVDVEADALDSVPDPDDAGGDNNRMTVDLEGLDRNDLP